MVANTHRIEDVQALKGFSLAQIIAAYLMMTEQLGHAEAICLVRRLKHDVQPNDGFQQQLQLWKVSILSNKCYR